MQPLSQPVLLCMECRSSRRPCSRLSELNQVLSAVLERPCACRDKALGQKSPVLPAQPEAPTGSPHPVQVIVDPSDDIELMQAALRAHAPERGRVAVHIAPTRWPNDGVSRSLLSGLGKQAHFPLGPGPCRRLSNVASIWVHAMGIRHIIVCRAHNSWLGAAWRDLLALHQFMDLRLTLLWSQPWKGTSRLADVPHHVITSRPAAHAAFVDTPLHPYQASSAMSLGSMAQADRPALAPVFAAATRGRAVAVPLVKRRTCPGADSSPAAMLRLTGPEAEPGPGVAARLLQIPDPVQAAVLAIAAVTGTGLRTIAETRTCDIALHGHVVMTHRGTTAKGHHRRCFLHALPPWAHPLLRAARLASRLPPYEGSFDWVRQDARRLHRLADETGVLLSQH